jgi:glutamate-1-semialdehyde aminotransferase
VNFDVGVAHAFLSDRPILSALDVLAADAAGYRQFCAQLLRCGVHVPPRGLLYISTEHTKRELDTTREAVRTAARVAGAARTRVLDDN